MTEFLSDDFLLQNETARKLYHDCAAGLPIYDYHNHLPADQIADDINFETITRAWLAEDHYKWRAMRANGVDEKHITGDTDDFERFEKWAETVPYCLCNPLYHWTHLELKRYFGVNSLLNGDTARDIYDRCNELLKSPEFSVRSLLRKANVKLSCGIEKPLSNLAAYKKIREDGFEIKAITAFLADQTFIFDTTAELNGWINQLAEVTDIDVKDFSSYVEAIRRRHGFFHDNGCRISDRGVPTIYAEDYSEKEIGKIFQKIRAEKDLDAEETLKFKSAMMYENALMDAELGWVQQFHLGVIRNNRTAMMRTFGRDAGCDSMADIPVAVAMSKFFDRLDNVGQLPKTIIYNLNPSVNEVIITMLGNFQDGSSVAKMQHGAAWWFLDQKDGIEKHLTALSNLGLLSRFIGMLTDSRSFLSFSRHEYFRRILCNFLGRQVEEGLLPNDVALLTQMLEDVCFNNAKNYFPMELE